MAAVGFSLSFARGVNHGKQSSLFHNGAVKKEREARVGHGARAKSVFMLEIMAARVTAFGNIVAWPSRVLNPGALIVVVHFYRVHVRQEIETYPRARVKKRNKEPETRIN